MFTMSDIQELTALVHQLVQPEASNMQRVNAVLKLVDISRTITTDVQAESKVELFLLMFISKLNGMNRTMRHSTSWTMIHSIEEGVSGASQ